MVALLLGCGGAYFTRIIPHNSYCCTPSFMQSVACAIFGQSLMQPNIALQMNFAMMYVSHLKLCLNSTAAERAELHVSAAWLVKR